MIGAMACFCGVSAFAADSLGDQLQHAFHANIPDKALTCFAEQIEVSVMGKGSVCSSEQAVEILRDFMQNNPVVSCQILHKGKKSQRRVLYYECNGVYAKTLPCLCARTQRK